VTEGLGDLPYDVRALVREREEARRRRQFDRADGLRERIRAAGFEVTDRPDGPTVARIDLTSTPIAHRWEDVPSLVAHPPNADATVHWLAEDWPGDVLRGIESIRRHQGSRLVRHVVVDSADPPGSWPEDVELVRVDPSMGWAASVNAGLRRTRGEIVVVAGGSIEAEGDAIGPLIEAFRDPSIGITGPFGVVSEDLHEFREADGPDVDAVEAYLMAFRRDLLPQGLRFDEKFRFYRSADLDLSFQIKALGLRAAVTSVPVRRHVHRRWEATPEAERARLSKRNFYRFLDRWRGRSDLLEVNRRGTAEP
jgi:hypothetical protein